MTRQTLRVFASLFWPGICLRIFTKLMKIAIALLRRINIHLEIYLDDELLMFSSQSDYDYCRIRKMQTECEDRLKSVRNRTFFGPYFPAFGLRYSISLRIQSKFGKIWTRKSPNKDTFHVVWKSRNVEASSEWILLPCLFQAITKIMG